MALTKIADLYPHYRDEVFGGNDLKGNTVYSEAEEKIGEVCDIIVDETGSFRYLVINTNFLDLGKKVLLPIGLAAIDADRDRIHAKGFTIEQAEKLPAYNDDLNLDYDYEEKVRNAYRIETADLPKYDRYNYQYDYDPALYNLSQENHRQFNHYQTLLLGHKDLFVLGDRVDNNSLYKIADLYPNYQAEIFGDDDLKGYSVCDDNEEGIGSVEDLLVDGNGYFRYFVVTTSLLDFAKKILLPVGYANIDRDRNRIHAVDLSKQQVESLPEYSDEMTVDYDYEEKVRSILRQPTTNAGSLAYNQNSYSYKNDSSLYNMNEREHQRFKLYEERLIGNKHRFSIGTVSVGKRVETETAQISVPIEKERVIIERKQPTDTEPIASDATAFIEGEIARVEIYEESANIEKQTFVREEVAIRKEVERDTVNLQGTVRREELEVDTDNQ